MTTSYTHILDLAKEVEPPADGTLSRTLFRNDQVKAVVFGFGQGQELSELLMTWFRDHDLKNLSLLSRETLILVPLGLPFFVPLAFAERLGLGFWSALAAGLLLATVTIGGWLMFAPPTS